MHSKRSNKPHNRAPFRNVPASLNDPMLQQITMMALMSRPDIDRQLEEALYMIEGITNTIRIMRRGMESFNTSMREAQQHMQSLPHGQAYSSTKKANFQQPEYNNYNPLPVDDSDNNNNSSTPEQF